jgi:hypothetical protein
VLIDRTYFVGEINIPNTTTAAIGGLLDVFIEKYEKKFLTEVLGYELYKAFTDGLAEVTVEDKWIDLRDGIEYTDSSGKTRFYPGLISAISGPVTVETSPIANYVYYWFARNAHSQTATMGEVKSKNENADVHSPALKMTRAWNEMSAWTCELKDYLDNKKDIYPAWESQDVWCMMRSFRPINEFNI